LQSQKIENEISSNEYDVHDDAGAILTWNHIDMQNKYENPRQKLTRVFCFKQTKK
jgi:hypothetical protein